MFGEREQRNFTLHNRSSPTCRLCGALASGSVLHVRQGMQAQPPPMQATRQRTLSLLSSTFCTHLSAWDCATGAGEEAQAGPHAHWDRAVSQSADLALPPPKHPANKQQPSSHSSSSSSSNSSNNSSHRPPPAHQGLGAS